MERIAELIFLLFSIHFDLNKSISVRELTVIKWKMGFQITSWAKVQMTTSTMQIWKYLNYIQKVNFEPMKYRTKIYRQESVFKFLG